MTIKTLQKIWKIGETILDYTIVFWIMETIYFLIIHGWHWKAINDYEEICDSIVSLGFTIGFTFIFVVIFSVISSIVNDNNIE